uniref:Uncharacterized protein n=1 Tax=Rhizophora mucronata TaxID=61149 RepID=A0A2P2PKD7_RHIMU
MVVVECKS